MDRKLPLQLREAEIQGPPPSKEERTFEIAIASGIIVDRYWGREQLLMDPSAVVMDRAGQDKGIPLLFNHDTDELIGRVYGFRIDSDQVARGTATLASTEEALEALQLILDGALVDVSVGYRIHEITTLNPNKPDELNLVTKWEPYEASLVSIPADATVGVGRGVSATEFPVLVTRDAETGLSPTPAPLVAGTPEVRMEPKEPTPAASPAAPIPNLAELQTKAAQDALQIRALAAKFGLERDAEELLGTRSIEETRKELMFRITDKQPIVNAPIIPLTDQEAKSWSLVRAINALVDQAEGRRASGFEVEISEELAKRTPSNYAAKGGIFIPMQLRAGLDSISAGKGNELKFTEYGGELIELLRNAMVLQAMGVRTLSGLTSPLAFPIQTGADTAYWVGENPAADVTASALTLSSRTLIPRTLQATTSFSRQLLQQAVYGVEQLVREDFVAVHARAYDLAGLHASGAAADPTGIYQTANVSTEAFGGGITWAHILNMVAKVMNANALQGSLGFVTNPTMAGVAAGKPKVASYPQFIWEGKLSDGVMAGYKAMASAQVSATMSTLLPTGGSEQGLIFGNWADAILGFFGAAEIIIDPYSLKKRGMIELTSFQMVDFMVRHPGSFCVSTGMTTA